MEKLSFWDFANFAEHNRPNSSPDILQYINGTVGTSQECFGVVLRQVRSIPDISKDAQNLFPDISKDFWNKYPGMLETFNKKVIKMSDTFFDKFAILANFLDKFPRMWDKFWDKFPGMLKEFKKDFPEMMDDFWVLFPLSIKQLVENNFPNMLCIIYEEGNACKRDSGGPLATKPEEDDGVTPGQNYEQIGLSSYGLDGGACNSSGYSGFARVTDVLDWIKESVGTDHTKCERK